MDWDRDDRQVVMTLLELNGRIRNCVERGMPEEYWVQAELSDVRTNASGHCYMELLQKDERTHQLVARARGVVWNQVFRLLKPYFEETAGQPFESGIKVLVRVSVQCHELYGLSLVIGDIDPAFTLGDLARRRREILQQLEEDGVLTLNKELEMPLLPQRVAVVSSATAAGYGDFCDQLEHNAYGFAFRVELFPAFMQGNQLESSVLDALERICNRKEDFDVVVLIRGGGATSDLAAFDSYWLAAACAQLPLPLITGIGHERDDTVIDVVAHTRVKTPTAAAEYLIGRLAEQAGRLDGLAETIARAARERLANERQRLAEMHLRIPALALRRLAHEKTTVEMLERQLKQGAERMLTGERHRLELLEQRVKDASPEKILARGYAIVWKHGKAVRDVQELNGGENVQVSLWKGRFRAQVEGLPAEDE